MQVPALQRERPGAPSLHGTTPSPSTPRGPTPSPAWVPGPGEGRQRVFVPAARAQQRPRGVRAPGSGPAGAPCDSGARSSGRTWVEVPARESRTEALRRRTERLWAERGRSLPGAQRCGSQLREDLERLSLGSAAPPAPLRVPAAAVCRRAHSLMQTHALPESSTRDPEPRTRTRSGPHTRHPPARHRIPRSLPPRRHLPFQTTEMRGPLFGWPWVSAAAQSSSSSNCSASPDRARGPGMRQRGTPGEVRLGGGGVISWTGLRRLSRHPAQTETSMKRRSQKPDPTPPLPRPSQPFLPPGYPSGAQYPPPGEPQSFPPGQSHRRI